MESGPDTTKNHADQSSVSSSERSQLRTAQKKLGTFGPDFVAIQAPQIWFLWRRQGHKSGQINEHQREGYERDGKAKHLVSTSSRIKSLSGQG